MFYYDHHGRAIIDDRVLLETDKLFKKQFFYSNHYRSVLITKNLVTLHKLVVTSNNYDYNLRGIGDNDDAGALQKRSAL